MTLRRVLTLILAALICLLFTSCRISNGGYSDKKAATEKFEEVLESIKAEDKDALKNAFSKKALAEAADLDDHIDYLFDFFKGNAISYDDPTVGSTGRRNDGKKQIEVVAWFDVTTDEDDYVFFLHLFSVDTFDADNVGLYALRVVKAEERETEMTFWQDMAIPGVYRPHK